MSSPRPSYSLEEARALLPEIRATLLQLAVERRRHAEAHAALHARLRSDGDRQQAADVREAEERVAELRDVIAALMELLEHRGLQVRDLDEGLVDIPTERDGEQVWFCWRLADPDLAFWHSTREGFAARKPL